MSKRKYCENDFHRENVKAKSIEKYHGNPDFKKRVIAAVTRKRQQRKQKLEDFDFVMEQFSEKMKEGPDFVCCISMRSFFKNQVLHRNKDDYSKRTDIALIANKCITEKYLHKCTDECEEPCIWMEMGRGQLWICHNCHNKINKAQIPAECILNSMELHPIPPELACLNSLEQHLTALHIPFMKMLALPKGGQNGVHGPVTCVPANIVETTNLLPRSNMEGSLLRVKLKCELTYKGHYEYQFVDTMHIKGALLYFRQNNKYFKDVEFNDTWRNELCREQEDVNIENECNEERNVTSTDTTEDEHLHDRQQHCMFQDTCLMPVDIGQEVLDQYFDSTLNLAPAEGNSPVQL